MSEYKPGALAVATVRGVPSQRAMRVTNNRWITPDYVAGSIVHYAGEVTDIRPLVVLNPVDTYYPSEIRAYVSAMTDDYPTIRRLASWLADQIEAQTTPPKPEPTKLGATHTDKQGRTWVLAAPSRPRPWYCEELAHGSWATWSEVSA